VLKSAVIACAHTVGLCSRPSLVESALAASPGAHPAAPLGGLYITWAAASQVSSAMLPDRLQMFAGKM